LEVGTQKCGTYHRVTNKVIATAQPRKVPKPIRYSSPEGRTASPELDAIVQEIIGRIADKWTMLVLEVVAEHGVLRFTRLAELLGNVSQKMLTKTLRQMESDGFVTRTVHPVVPPRVEYELTRLGASLGEAFCGVWLWAEKHHAELGVREKRFANVPERKLACEFYEFRIIAFVCNAVMP
jgi:DNA-binding HxlR family transcriptional regulator